MRKRERVGRRHGSVKTSNDDGFSVSRFSVPGRWRSSHSSTRAMKPFLAPSITTSLQSRCIASVSLPSPARESIRVIAAGSEFLARHLDAVPHGTCAQHLHRMSPSYSVFVPPSQRQLVNRASPVAFFPHISRSIDSCPGMHGMRIADPDSRHRIPCGFQEADAQVR